MNVKSGFLPPRRWSLSATPRSTCASTQAAKGFRPLRAHVVLGAVLCAFAAVTLQIVRFVAEGPRDARPAVSFVPHGPAQRPGLVDRHGNLLAIDVPFFSLFADPSRTRNDLRAVAELKALFPDLDVERLTHKLAEKSRRFVWVRRRLDLSTAERVRALRLPGFGFQREVKRVYPLGELSGHLIAAAEQAVSAPSRDGTATGSSKPLRLALDIGVAQALDSSLREAVLRYRAKGAAGLVLDIHNGELLASASLPEVDPGNPGTRLDPSRTEKVFSGVYELGSIFKLFTLALALESGTATLDTVLDVRSPLKIGSSIVHDLHPARRPLRAAEVFLRSSNVGAGLLALAAGRERQQEFLSRLGLLDPLTLECGRVAAPLLPRNWGKVETVTISYGHGLAVAPLQAAVAAAAIINGGSRIKPTILAREGDAQPSRHPAGQRVVSPATSHLLQSLMRRNVQDSGGTGRLAEAPGYRPGGKTGTADVPESGGYREGKVISSFLAAFPMDNPAYLVLLALFEPQGTEETRGGITAGLNAAPVTGQLIVRIAPLLGILPGRGERKLAAGK